MEISVKRIISILILLVIMGLAGYYLVSNIDDFKDLKFESPEYLIILIFLFILNYLIIGIVTKELLTPLGVALSGKEAFGLSVVTGFYNLITPFRGGMAARAIYLKKKHAFSYTNFLSTLAASYILIFLVSGIIGLLSTYLIYLSTGNFSSIIFIIFLITTISMSSIMFFSPRFSDTKYKWINRIINVVNGWHLIKNNKRVVFVTTFFSFIQLITGAVMLYLQFKVFGFNISFIGSLFLSAIGSLGILVAVTPAGLGISETIIVFSAATIGISPAESLSAALLGRAVSLFVLFILGPIFSYKLIKNEGNSKGEQIHNRIRDSSNLLTTSSKKSAGFVRILSSIN